MSTPLHTPSTTGRRGTGAPTPGRQPDQPHRPATGRRAAADPQHPVVSVHRPSAAPQRGGHRERHSPDRATGPTSGGRDPGPHPRQPSGPRRRNRLASKWEQRLRLDFQHPHRTLLPANATSCGGVGARRWWTKRWASHSPECWSAISTPPTTITMAPSNGAGPTCCGISTTWWCSTPRTPRWPSRPRQSISSMSRPGLSPILRHNDGAPLNWPGSGSCWSSASPSWLTR